MEVKARLSGVELHTLQAMSLGGKKKFVFRLFPRRHFSFSPLPSDARSDDVTPIEVVTMRSMAARHHIRGNIICSVHKRGFAPEGAFKEFRWEPAITKYSPTFEISKNTFQPRNETRRTALQFQLHHSRIQSEKRNIYASLCPNPDSRANF